MKSKLFVLLMIVTSAAQGGVAETLVNPLPLTRIALVTDLDAPIDDDDPGTGGAFANSSYFRNRLTDGKAIDVCIDQVEKSSEIWAKSVGLSRSLRDRQSASLSLHFMKAGLDGIFSLKYAVTSGMQAWVRVDFYRLNGERQAPEAAAPLLAAYQIADFQDALDSALQCKSGMP